jgi:hypothetical protein
MGDGVAFFIARISGTADAVVYYRRCAGNASGGFVACFEAITECAVIAIDRRA